MEVRLLPPGEGSSTPCLMGLGAVHGMQPHSLPSGLPTRISEGGPGPEVLLQRDNRTFNRILDRIQDLRRFNVPADYIMVGGAVLMSAGTGGRLLPCASSPCPACPLLAVVVPLPLPPRPAPSHSHALPGPTCTRAFTPQVKSRPVDRLWFYNRSPVITARQSAEIVRAMKRLGFLDADGNLKYDPRIGALVGAAAGGRSSGLSGREQACRRMRMCCIPHHTNRSGCHARLPRPAACRRTTTRWPSGTGSWSGGWTGCT